MAVELPKELTPKLLGLVLSLEVTKLDLVEDTDLIKKLSDDIIYVCKIDSLQITARLNIDTLARLMKEWCCKQGGLDILSGIESDGNHQCSLWVSEIFQYTKYFFGYKTEFEAVLKAAEWVAKEKGPL